MLLGSGMTLPDALSNQRLRKPGGSGSHRVHARIPLRVALVNVLEDRRALLLVKFGRIDPRQAGIEQVLWRRCWRWYRSLRRRRADGRCQWSLHYPESCGLAPDSISNCLTRKQKGVARRGGRSSMSWRDWPGGGGTTDRCPRKRTKPPQATSMRHQSHPKAY